MMYRVLAIIGGAFALAACSSTPDWASLDAFKSGASLDTVSLESEPPGAEAPKIRGGSICCSNDRFASSEPFIALAHKSTTAPSIASAHL